MDSCGKFHHFLIILCAVLMTMNFYTPVATAASSSSMLILEHPSSLLVPVNKTAVFTARAFCMNRLCHNRWSVNLIYHFDRNEFVPSPELWNGDELSVTLSMNVSESINNTKVYCEFDEFGINSTYLVSEPATLIVISDLPLPTNPHVEMNASFISIEWSPPYLWPGHAIDDYNVSFVNESDGSVTYYNINSNFSDSVVSFRKEIQEETMECTEVTVNVSASSATQCDSDRHFFSVTEWILPLTLIRDDFNSLVISTSPCYSSDGLLSQVEVNFQLPESLCTDMELNYSLIIKNTLISGDSAIELGPFSRIGPGSVKRNITSYVTANQRYSLKVQVQIMTEYTQQLFTSSEHHFSTFINWTSTHYITTNHEVPKAVDDVLVNKVLMGVSLFAVVVMLSALSFSMYVHCRRKRLQWKIEEQRRRLRRNMVINPIYDQNELEHQYEHIPAFRHFQPNTFFLDQTDNCTVTATTCVLDDNHTNEQGNDTNTTRYVDTPVHSENINQTLSLESNEKYVFHHNDADDGISNPRPVYVKTDDEQSMVSRLSLNLDDNDGAESTMVEDELKSKIDDLLMALDSELSDGDKSYGVLTLVDPREC